MPSKERQAATALAEALREVGLNEMAGRADALHYSDFSSTLPGPKLALGEELQTAAELCGPGPSEKKRQSDIWALRARMIRGEFDG